MTISEKYNKALHEHPGKVVLMRIGDFIETFGETAEIVGAVMGKRRLPSRQGVAMFAVPAGEGESLTKRLGARGLDAVIINY